MSEEVQATNEGDGGTANIIYILYLAGLVVGITGLVGVIMAYINKGDAPDWLQTHYQFQIRTFWIGFLYAIIGMITIPIFIGFLILLFWLVWFIVRCVKGMQALGKKEAVANPTGWLF